MGDEVEWERKVSVGGIVKAFSSKSGTTGSALVLGDKYRPRLALSDKLYGRLVLSYNLDWYTTFLGYYRILHHSLRRSAIQNQLSRYQNQRSSDNIVKF